MSETVPAIPVADGTDGGDPSIEVNDEQKILARKKKLLALTKKGSGQEDTAVSEEDGSANTALGSFSAPLPVLTKSPPANPTSPTLPMTPISTSHNTGTGSPQSPLSITGASGTSPFRLPRSASPRLLSPASSSIFERNVQENHPLPEDVSGNIPSHIQTEDYIPAVLEASSRAITDDGLDPDEVEIVTHSLHMSASVAVAAGTLHGSEAISLHSPTGTGMSPFASQELASNSSEPAEETASTYGSIDTNDVRRLSFISFADVVQAENVEAMGPRDSILHGPLSLSPARNRSPSPVHSPGSVGSQAFSGRASPPISGGSGLKQLRNITSAPSQAAAGAVGSVGSSFSVGQASPPLGGELVMEKMSAALKVLGPGTGDEVSSG